MQSPLDASANTVGALFSNSTFEVPQYQREYSWQIDEVNEFWHDLKNNLDSDSYFLGLVILTANKKRKNVVDGQQRIVTITLLAIALYHEALRLGRKALADRIQVEFLQSIDYETDETKPRVVLSDNTDNTTLQTILITGETPPIIGDNDSVSFRIIKSFEIIKYNLEKDLKPDPFKRLGKWTDFLTNRVYLAIFVHPDDATAYQVFEVINTRGRDLTTADLLKNYILSQTPIQNRENRYEQWRTMSRSFATDGANNIFVQFIRHAVTVRSGHILPKALFAFLANREQHTGKKPPSPEELMVILEEYMPMYLQMVDPTSSGPFEGKTLRMFSALNDLNIITVRPILLALSGLPHSEDGVEYILRLVVRRIVVGILGTGNIERRFGEAARSVFESKNWETLKGALSDLNPTRDDFVSQLSKRSFNKGTLTFLRRSILQKSISPDPLGTLHFIWPKNTPSWHGISEDEGSYWAATIGNTFLSNLHNRPKEASVNWQKFREYMLNEAAEGEWVSELSQQEEWNSEAIETIGTELAESAAEIWYGG